MFDRQIDAIAETPPGLPSGPRASPTERCACGGTGTILVEGPGDAAPLEAPCPWLDGPVEAA